MYFSYIHPLLEYSDIVCENCNQRDTKLLKKIQTEASASQILRETAWETLAHIRYKYRMITMHKIHNNTTHSYLTDLLPAQTG